MQNSVLKNRSLQFLLSAKLISTIGTFAQSTAFALYVIDKTHSSVLFATVLMATLIPKVIFSPLCGVVVDWFSRKKLLVVLDVLSGVLLLAAIASIGSGEAGMPLIFAISIGLGLISAIYEPTTIAAIPTIVEKEGIDGANSLGMIVAALGNFLGPVLGVVIYGYFGITLAIAINAASFMIAALLEVFMRIPSLHLGDERRTLARFKTDFLDGLTFLFQNSRMKLIIICILIQNCFFNGASQVGIPFIARETLRISTTEFAFIDMILIIGVVVGAVLSGAIKKNLTTDQLFVRMLIFIGMAFAGMALLTGFIFNLQINFFLIMALYLVLGITSINVTIAFQSELQKEVDNKLLGRISSIVYSLILVSVPVGQGLYGWMFKVLPPAIPLALTAIAIVVVALSYKSASNGFVSIVSEEPVQKELI